MRKEQNKWKNLSTGRKVRRCILSMILLLVVAFVGALIYVIAFSAVSGMDVKISSGVRTTVTGDAPSSSDSSSEPRDYFATPEEAYEYNFLHPSPANENRSGRAVDATELYRFTENGQLFCLFFLSYSDSGEPDTVVAGFYQSENGYAITADYGFYRPSARTQPNSRYFFTLLSKTLRDIEFEATDYTFNSSVVSIPVPSTFYYGISTDPAIKTLTISGRAPDGFIEHEYEGTTYYIWYYSNLDVLGMLDADPDFTFSNYTLRQMNGILNVHIDGVGEE